jgi:ribonuclease HI
MRIQVPPTWIKGQLYAYTDGSTFRSNPGPISWAVVYVRDGAILYNGNKERSHVGAYATGTNMRAELYGLIWALKYETTEDLIVMTDSQVMVNCANGDSKRHANKDLWEQYEEFLLAREKRNLITQITHVKGHGNDPFNRHVDKMASAHARQNYALTNVG